MAGGRFWTTLEIKELERLLSLDISHAGIGKRLNRTTSSIAQRAASLRPKKERLPRLHAPGKLGERVKLLAIPGVHDSCIAEILGVCSKTIQTTRRRLGISPGMPRGGRIKRDVTKANISVAAKILRLYSGVGRTNAEIAKTLGIPNANVSYYIARFGLQSLGKGTEGYGHFEQSDKSVGPRLCKIYRGLGPW